MTINIPNYEDLFKKLQAQFANHPDLPELEKRLFPLFNEYCGKSTVPFWVVVLVAKVIVGYLGESLNEIQLRELFGFCSRALVSDENTRIIVQNIFDREYEKIPCYYHAM